MINANVESETVYPGDSDQICYVELIEAALYEKINYSLETITAPIQEHVKKKGHYFLF